MFAAVSIPKDASDEVLEKHYQEALQFTDEAKFREAIEILDRLAELRPESGNVWYIRALCRAQLGELSSARSDVSQAIRLSPDIPEDYELRAQIAFQQEDYESAIEDIDEAIELRPGEVSFLALRANVQVRRKQFPAAVRDLTSIVESGSADASVYNLRAALYEDEGQLESAAADFSRVVELAPEAHEGYGGRSWLRFYAGQWADAAADAAKVRTLLPNDAAAYRLGGYTAFALGQYDEAVTLLARSVELAGTTESDSVVYALLVRHYALQRLQRAPDDLLARAVPEWKDNPWATALGRFALGQSSEDELRAAALQAKDERTKTGQTCELHFYIGLARSLAGDRSTAQLRFEACRATAMTTFVEHALAAAELAR